MDNKKYSRKDMVELCSKYFGGSYRQWRSLFKFYGWHWPSIWKKLEDEGFITIGDNK